MDLGALEANFHSVRRFVGEDINYLAVVKADAYGHGAVQCAKLLEAAGIDWFGVAIPAEGIELRKHGITKRILCLGGFWPGQEEMMLDHGLTPVIYRSDQIEAYNRAARSRGSVAEVHVKVDTGMGRIGFREEELDGLIRDFGKCESLHLEGLMTHFAAADDPAEDEFTDLQTDRFEKAAGAFETAGFKLVFKDLANSPASIAHPSARGNMVRLGGVLYGLCDDVLPPNIDLPRIEPVLSLYSSVAHIKEIPEGESLGYGRTFVTGRNSRIAIIPIGYQDGYARSLSNRSRVIIAGRFAPVVGRVSMDWTLVDVTDVPDAETGSKVVLIGSDGENRIKAEELARLTGTISYEITCGINRRVERVYR